MIGPSKKYGTIVLLKLMGFLVTRALRFNEARTTYKSHLFLVWTLVVSGVSLKRPNVSVSTIIITRMV